MKYINKYFVSRKYYDGACAAYQKAIAHLMEENKLYETKVKKIIECMGLLKAALNDYDDICEVISKIADVDCNLRAVTYKLGRILDDNEMF